MADRPVRVVPAVGAVIRDDDGRLLLVRRGHAPQQGRWSVPGGHVEPGETLREAVLREVREETGLEVEVSDELGSVRLPSGAGAVFDVHDFAATVVGGEARAADDADDVGWFSADDLVGMPLTTDLLAILAEYGVEL